MKTTNIVILSLPLAKNGAVESLKPKLEAPSGYSLYGDPLFDAPEDQLNEIDAQISDLINSLETVSTTQIIDRLNTIRKSIINTEMMIRRQSSGQRATDFPEDAAPVIEDEPAPIADPADDGELDGVATNEGEPEPPLTLLDLLKEAAERIADHSLTRADYDLAAQAAEMGRTHPGWTLAMTIAIAWETDPDLD